MNKKEILNDNDFIDWLFDNNIYQWEDERWMSDSGFLTEDEVIELYKDYLEFEEKLYEFKNKRKCKKSF